MDKHIQKSERLPDGTCPGCRCRHMHRDWCPVLQQRNDPKPDDDLDTPMSMYIGGHRA